MNIVIRALATLEEHRENRIFCFLLADHIHIYIWCLPERL